jgi:Heavy metal associated domain 2
MSVESFHGLHVAHSIPGRTRLKFPELKRHPHRHQTLQRALTSIPGVHQVEVSSQTGSVVLYHDKDAIHSMQFLGAIAAAFGLTGLAATEVGEWAALLENGSSSEAVDVLERAEKAGAALHRTLTDLTGGHLDVNTLLPVILVLLGVRSLVVSEALVGPKWYEFFWFAFGAYFTLNKPESPGDAAT